MTLALISFIQLLITPFQDFVDMWLIPLVEHKDTTVIQY